MALEGSAAPVRDTVGAAHGRDRKGALEAPFLVPEPHTVVERIASSMV